MSRAEGETQRSLAKVIRNLGDGGICRSEQRVSGIQDGERVFRAPMDCVGIRLKCIVDLALPGINISQEI